MKFEDIKSALDSEAQNTELGADLAFNKESMMPLARIRKKMRGEIYAQSVIIVIFIAGGFMIPMAPLSRSVYIIFMTVTCLMTLGYLFHLNKFVKRSSKMNGSTRSVLNSILAEFNSTIEIYKMGINAGSLLLPISSAALLLGVKGKDDLFEKWFLLDLSTAEMTMAILGYLFLALFIMWTTGRWADYMYGEEKSKIEQQLAGLMEEGIAS